MASRRGGWRWPLVLGGAAAVLGVGLTQSWEGGAPATIESRTAEGTGSPADAPPVAASPTLSSASTPPTVATDRRAALPPAPATAPDPVPAGLGAEQWQQVQAALADHPQRDAELRRIAAFLQLQGRVQAFAEARQRGATRSELAALARPLQAELPRHLALGELSAPEALRLQAALLEVTEPDTAAANQALADWRARHLSRPTGEAPHDPREVAFAQAQQAALATWQAGGGQDPQALERDLERLRSAHFDAGR